MFRLQGTDGVRKFAAHSSRPDLSGLTPQRAFVERGVITEQFMELYTFARARQIIASGAAARGEPFVIGWDPRDPDGLFTSAAVRGIAKAGLCPWTLGVAPTPMCALFAQWAGAAGTAVVTASHNPAAYNGIKMFTRRGLKLLPPDDVKLTELVTSIDYAGEVANARLMAPIVDKPAEAREVFLAHVLDPENSWIPDTATVRNVSLVVDCANGAMSSFAQEILKKAGFVRVETFYTSLDGDVNRGCGVAELDGIREITAQMAIPGGRLYENQAITRMFQLGRAEREAILNGERRVWAAVFDGDGDRLYLAVYDPTSDSARILDGDGVAILQAWRMAGGGGTFVNTVESGINAAIAVEKMGYRVKLAAVGDKWILTEAMMGLIKAGSGPETIALVEKLASEGTAGSDLIEEILDGVAIDFSGVKPPAFIGAEESGHLVTAGFMRGGGRVTPVYHGSGIKCLLNTAAAIMEGGMDAMAEYTTGFKKTIYVYHVDKDKWTRGASVWKRAVETITAWAKGAATPLETTEMIRPEEPDMLYIKLMHGQAHVASVFLRSSGTEDKTGVSLRGPMSLETDLLALGEKLIRPLMLSIKNPNSPMGRAETALLTAAAQGGAPHVPVSGLGDREYQRLLEETAKQGLIDAPRPGARLTERGNWLLPLIRVGQ
jgi:phosphomannomutase